MTSVFACIVLAFLFLAQVYAWAFSVKLGTRWAGISTTWSRVVWLAIVFFSISMVSRLLLFLTMGKSEPIKLAALATTVLVELFFPLLLFQRAFSAKAIQVLKIWVLTWFGHGAAILIATLVIRPFFVDTFAVPTNGMAPTLVGRRVEGVCPQCGEITYRTPLPPHAMRGEHYVICERFHSTAVPGEQISLDDEQQSVTSADRVFVNKWLEPKRWDLIAFRTPSDPSTNYLMRLVGLPGETLQIIDGQIWIDGEVAQLPRSLQGLRYDPPPMMNPEHLSGNDPVMLDDEYFVLGDNSKSSYDSRIWRSGAENHPPYAVPKEFLVGVATHIYWPTNRIRILR